MERIKMEDDIELIREPNYTKKLHFMDIMNYAQKYNLLVNKEYLKHYNFLDDEINWLLYYKQEEIDMQNKKIQVDLTNEEIIKLKKQLKKLENENKGLNKPNINTIGWKGKDSLKVEKLDDEWLVTEHRKSKHREKLYQSKHYIPFDNVDNVLKIIKLLTSKDNLVTSYRSVAQTLIIKNNLNVDIESFNGGRNRNKYLFPLYYYPVKILEYLKIIEYSGGGKITLLKFDED